MVATQSICVLGCFVASTFGEHQDLVLFVALTFWINMGAMAISTLAGTMLVRSAPSSALLHELLPMLKGFSLWYWATATWWIPMLVILAIWRHGVKRFPLSYDPLYWGAVFPLGMYTVATFRLSGAVGVPALLNVPRVFVFVALAAWGATFVGFVNRQRRLVLRSGAPSQ